jgi:hypothetical protein
MPRYRIVPALKPGQMFELMGRKAEYLGGSHGEHEFRVNGELDTRTLSDVQLLDWLDAGALRLLRS